MLRFCLKSAVRTQQQQRAVRAIGSTVSAKSIIDDCQVIRKSVQELNDRFKGPLLQSTQMNTVMPFVFLLGNHSSGKSSFVNYLLQRKVQSAGVAPTDDSFTVIAPGPQDVDRDGPAFIGDPDMGFAQLKNFGPNLVHHTMLKIRSSTTVQDFMIVDTPGMIDSPRRTNSANSVSIDGKQVSAASLLTGHYHDSSHSHYSSEQQTMMLERGYDFERVCRWYAERADVILLFFDPDKPGTTGETLTVLTNSLAGMDHKLHIILNKADQFEKIHDFARAYGSLCWNLSKVIHRKDLPRIYTMCLPHKLDESKPLGKSMMDLETTREEVVKEVMNAPGRRVNNEVSRLADSVQLLHMHCRITDEVVKRYKQLKFKLVSSCTALLAASVGMPAASYFVHFPWEVTAGTGILGLISSGSMFWYTSKSLEDNARHLVSNVGLNSVYRQLYTRQIADNDEFIESLWKRVLTHLQIGLSAGDVASLSRVKTTDMYLLNNIIDAELPRLRRNIAPTLAAEKDKEPKAPDAEE